MADSEIRSDPAGYIAFEVKSGLESRFWLKTKNETRDIINIGWDYPHWDDDTRPFHYNFTPIISMKTKVERDYAGINSSGGPQVAGRADHDEIEITKYSDLLSPILYQFVSTGECFKSVMIVLPGYGGNERVEWYLTGVNLTLFEFTGERSNASSLRYYADDPLSSARSISSEPTSRYYPRVDKLRLLYTTAELRVGEGEYDLLDSTGAVTGSGYKLSRTGWWGWDTGANDRLPADTYPTEDPEAVTDP